MKRTLIVTAGAILCAALWSAIPASAVTVWRVQQVPVPANASVNLQAVSCPATGVCFAVGYSTQVGTTIQSTLAERWSGGRWAILATPSPGPGPVDQLTRLSCLSATDCMAIGVISTQTAANSTLVEHWDGTSWTVLPGPKPVGTTVAGLTAVSCVSTTSCTAVGLYATSGNRPHELPVAEHWNGANWTVQHVPLPAGVTTGSLSAVSCRSATACIAVGSIATPNQPSNTKPLAEQWNGTSWTVRATPTPAGAYNPGFSDVSCTSRSRCTAVGGYLANGAESTLAERWDGTAWTIQSGVAPPGTGLTNVSCTSSVSCTAVGITGAFTVTPVADHWNGTSWTLQSMPVPHHSTRDVAMSGVSCRSATTCTAVGIYGRTAHPLADHE